MFDIAIIIPSFNEENYIEECLNSIVNQTYDFSKIEVFVCDGKSTDETQEKVSYFTKKHHNINLLINHQKTTPYALNLGIEAANSPIKIILGAHSYLQTDYIEFCLKTFKEHQDFDCVGGIIENIYETPNSKIIGMAMSSPFGVGNAHFRTGTKVGEVDTVAFGAYKQEVFEKCGLFDVSLKRNQDDEFNFRIIKNGFKIYLNPELKSNYYVRASYEKLVKQYYQYGLWKVFVNKKHKSVTSLRQLIPFFFICYLFMLLISAFVKPNVLMFLPLLIYFVGAFYFANKKTYNIKRMFLIVYTFLILHLSYGTGYLVGILKFYILRQQPNYKTPNITR
jgi:glycosyltransferase involved in cell wall biosynthesis